MNKDLYEGYDEMEEYVSRKYYAKPKPTKFDRDLARDLIAKDF